MKYSVSFRADTECTGGIHAYASVDFSGGGFNSRSYTACFDHSGNLSRMADRQCSFIEPLPNRDLHFSFFSIRKRRTDRFTEYMVLVVYRLKDDRAEFRKIKLTIVAEYAFVDAYVDDLADNVAFLRDLDKRAFQRDRQFVNDRCVYRVALCRVETGFLEFLRLFVARYDRTVPHWRRLRSRW